MPSGGDDCATIGVAGKWSNASCSSSAGFVCEISPHRGEGPFKKPKRFCEILGIACPEEGGDSASDECDRTEAFVSGEGEVDTDNAGKFFYDSLCQCIDGDDPDDERECFRSADCCPNKPRCFKPNSGSKATCTTCQAVSAECNVDADCCDPVANACKAGVCTLTAGDAVDVLVAARLTGDASSKVRLAAVKTLSRRPPSAPLRKAVSTAALKESDQDVRRRIVDVLALWLPKAPELKLVLERVVREDTSPRLRELAAKALEKT